MNRLETSRRRAVRRAAVSGSGPTAAAPARNPGAVGAFTLFGEVLLMGVVITAIGVALVTLPTVLAAAVRHLRRFIAAESSGSALFWRELRQALPGGLIVGAVAVAASFVFVVDVLLAGSGALPGGTLFTVVGWGGLAVTAVALLAAAGAWTPESGWAGAVRAVPSRLRDDVPGAMYLAAAAGFVGVVTWVLPPLILPALGCAALAVVAIPERPSAGGQS